MYLPAAFDKSIALEAAALVMQAYAQYAQGTTWGLQGDYDDLGHLSARPEWKPAPEPFGFVARNRTSGLVFVVYRGTESPQDWIADFTFPQVPHLLGNVERGFADVYDQTAGSVSAAIPRAGGAPPRRRDRPQPWRGLGRAGCRRHRHIRSGRPNGAL